jgi:hypothetical protein
MNFGVSAKAAVAVPGKAHAAWQAGRLAKVCNAARRRNAKLYKSRLPEGLPASAAAALPGGPWAPPKDGAGRFAATALAGNASHPKVHNTL